MAQGVPLDARFAICLFAFRQLRPAISESFDSMAIRIPRGFSFAAVHCGVKHQDPKKLDLSLIVSDRPATAAGVYTQNLVFAAPVALDRQRTPSDRIRAVVVNAGNANACTGQRGLDDALAMAGLAAKACGADDDAGLVMSTGVIGRYMPMDVVARGIEAAATQLRCDETAFVAAARGMMTTDTVHKVASRTLTVGGREIALAGMAKGAAMMGPNLATMLALVLTDAALDKQSAQSLLRAAMTDSFNCINIDGHTSTNDTVLLLANGAAETRPLAGDDLAAFAAALCDLCAELARMIPADGEGASHLITIEVTGGKTREAAIQIARTIANSPLVKCAIAGADPNWGRIVSAAGYAGVPFDPAGVSLHINGHLLYRGGEPVAFDAKTVSDSIRDHRETRVELQLSEGDARGRFWASDMTAEYVRLNADYTT
jgi:glutamate N-acetyltransferase/amino-acid N-acetyltransferase